jgi:hypothetical protein
MKLYHGSDVYITAIDLSLCNQFRDFGKGFYTTSISRHASERAADTAAKNDSSPVVTVFDFDETALIDCKLAVKRFPVPSVEWVEFVMRCRDRKISQPPHSYDIVEGPIANDKMRAQFSLFERGVIDMNTVLQRITYIENTHQISFHTPLAITLLKPEPDYPQVMMETTIGMLTEFLVEDRNMTVEEALGIVYNSSTFNKLLDRSSMLYRESPAYVYELLKKEIQ